MEEGRFLNVRNMSTPIRINKGLLVLNIIITLSSQIIKECEELY